MPRPVPSLVFGPAGTAGPSPTQGPLDFIALGFYDTTSHLHQVTKDEGRERPSGHLSGSAIHTCLGLFKRWPKDALPLNLDLILMLI